MPRIRSIKPEFFTSEQVVECSANARLLFIGMWCFCDDGGVHPASAKRLKMEVFPADEITSDDVQKLVDELIARHLVEIYVVDGKEFWHVTGWHHQRIDKPNFFYPGSQEFYEQSESVRRGLHDRSPTESSRVESSRKESKGVERKDACGEPAKPASPPAAASRVRGDSAQEARIDLESLEFPQFPCVQGKAKKSQVWLLTEAHIAELASAFPGVDVAQECRRAHLWIKDNPPRRKTHDGMRDFLANWMKREQNSGSSGRRSLSQQRDSINGIFS